MHKIVIDASIILKWVPGKNEERVEEARKIYTLMMDDKLEIWAPDFILLEVLNILANKRKTNKKIIKRIIEDFAHGKINFYNIDRTQIIQLEEIVYKYKLTAYDAQYLFLAQKEKCKLLTVDRQLLKLSDLTIDIDKLLEGQDLEKLPKIQKEISRARRKLQYLRSQ